MLKLLQTSLILLITNYANASSAIKPSSIDEKLQTIEQTYHVKIGVYALDTNNNQVIAYHAEDKFPFQSTCKFVGAAALLANNELPNKTVIIGQQAILPWHAISGQYINRPVTLKRLAEGAVSYSDNTAINTIIHELGGLKAINQFAHDLGNTSFDIKHYEMNLNSDPHNTADTSTPKDMGLMTQKLLLGDVLTPKSRKTLLHWMRNNTTGYNRIRAGAPLGWSVAEKTGSGAYGVANDIGIAWSPLCKPVVLSIFTLSHQPTAKPNDKVIEQATRAIFDEFGQQACYRAHM